MPRAEQTDSSDEVKDLRRELEGKFAWAIGILVVILIAVFGFIASEISTTNDKASRAKTHLII